MKKIIIGILLTILLVVSFGVITIVTDTYDEDVNYYINVQLYELYFQEDLEVALDEIEYAYLEIEKIFEDDTYDVDRVKFEEEINATTELIIDLQDRLTMIELDNVDVQGAHNHLINGVAFYQDGIESLHESYTNNDYDSFQDASEALALAYEQILFWEELLMGIEPEIDTET